MFDDIYSAFHNTFNKRFPKFVEIPEVCHELGNFITQLSIKSQNLNQSCKFHGELCWEVAKFCERGADTLGW